MNFTHMPELDKPYAYPCWWAASSPPAWCCIACSSARGGCDGRVAAWESGIGNREWGMGNGEWGMGNGEWGMGNGEWGIVEAISSF
nr:hypothetical protein [Xanthomonas cucurbitae]